MCQTFIILLRAGPQNNARLKPVLSAKKAADPWCTPTGKRRRFCPRTRWSDYISDLAWYRLGVEPAELFEIPIDRGVFRVLLGLLPPRISQRKSAHKYE